jgi:hypothetical protein
VRPAEDSPSTLLRRSSWSPQEQEFECCAAATSQRPRADRVCDHGRGAARTRKR